MFGFIIRSKKLQSRHSLKKWRELLVRNHGDLHLGIAIKDGLDRRNRQSYISHGRVSYYQQVLHFTSPYNTGFREGSLYIFIWRYTFMTLRPAFRSSSKSAMAWLRSARWVNNTSSFLLTVCKCSSSTSVLWTCSFM